MTSDDLEINSCTLDFDDVIWILLSYEGFLYALVLKKSRDFGPKLGPVCSPDNLVPEKDCQSNILGLTLVEKLWIFLTSGRTKILHRTIKSK